MQYERIQNTINSYLEEYPDSEIALTDCLGKEVSSGTHNSIFFIGIKMKILSEDVVIKEILHTTDLSKIYEKEETENIIYLLTEEPVDIYRCKHCNEIYGENSKDENKPSIDGYCDDCCEESKKNEYKSCSCGYYCNKCC